MISLHSYLQLHTKTVFYIPNESTSPQFYGVDILEVKFDIHGNVRLLVTWSHMEAGVSRSPFYVNYHEVCWQNQLGRIEDYRGI